MLQHVRYKFSTFLRAPLLCDKFLSRFLYSYSKSPVISSDSDINQKVFVTYLSKYLKLRTFYGSYVSTLCEVHTSNLSSNVDSNPEEPGQDTVRETVTVYFVTPEGEEVEAKGYVGDKILKLAQKYGVGCEGACNSQMACTTCHVYVDENYEHITGNPELKEEDLLDTAPFLKPNSRLGCQITLSKDLEGARFGLPHSTIHFLVDGYKPTPH